MTARPPLLRETAIFARKYRWLRDPQQAHGACHIASILFADLVRGARIWHLLGQRRAYPRRVDGYPALDPEFYHVVAEWRGYAFDWSRRQLDPFSPFPFIQPMTQVRAEWVRVARSADTLGLA